MQASIKRCSGVFRVLGFFFGGSGIFRGLVFFLWGRGYVPCLDHHYGLVVKGGDAIGMLVYGLVNNFQYLLPGAAAAPCDQFFPTRASHSFPRGSCPVHTAVPWPQPER